MFLLYLAWRYGGHDPYRLYNRLREDYRPLEDPSAEPCPPPNPARLASVIYAFANHARIEEYEMRGAGMAGLA